MNHFENYNIPEPQTNIKSERADLINQFLTRINNERIGSPYPPMTAKGVAMKVSHVKTGELHAFYKRCDSAKCEFGKVFFGALRVNK